MCAAALIYAKCQAEKRVVSRNLIAFYSRSCNGSHCRWFDSGSDRRRAFCTRTALSSSAENTAQQRLHISTSKVSSESGSSGAGEWMENRRKYFYSINNPKIRAALRPNDYQFSGLIRIRDKWYLFLVWYLNHSIWSIQHDGHNAKPFLSSLYMFQSIACF